MKWERLGSAAGFSLTANANFAAHGPAAWNAFLQAAASFSFRCRLPGFASSSIFARMYCSARCAYSYETGKPSVALTRSSSSAGMYGGAGRSSLLHKSQAYVTCFAPHIAGSLRAANVSAAPVACDEGRTLRFFRQRKEQRDETSEFVEYGRED